jgi:hypothetical protein
MVTQFGDDCITLRQRKLSCLKSRNIHPNCVAPSAHIKGLQAKGILKALTIA